MEKNAVILTTLESFLDVLDARARVNIFIEDQDKPLKLDTCLYNILADNDKFLGTYGNYNVIGLRVILGTTQILIKEA